MTGEKTCLRQVAPPGSEKGAVTRARELRWATEDIFFFFFVNARNLGKDWQIRNLGVLQDPPKNVTGYGFVLSCPSESTTWIGCLFFSGL